MDPLRLQEIAAQLLVIFFAIGIHEYAHCKFADMAGDPTPRIYGRVTLNLFKHFDPIGVLFIVLTTFSGFGLGWGKPSPVDPRKMRNPRWDHFASVAAGPASNLVQAILYGIVFRILIATDLYRTMPEFLQIFILFGIVINIALMVFNLIPFGPLDGHWLLGLLMPENLRYRWFRFNARIGVFGLFIAIILLQRSGIHLTDGPVQAIFRLISGRSL